MLRPIGLIFLFFLFVFSNCKKESSLFQGPLSDEEIFAIFENCRDNPDNQLSTDKAIAENLEGEWKLVAHGCGFCVPLKKAPKATLTLDKNSGVLDLEYGGIDDTLMTFDWVIEDARLVTTPSHFALAISTFCEDYILFDGRAYDGIMMIYQKQ